MSAWKDKCLSMYAQLQIVHGLPECLCLCQGLVIVHYIVYCAQLSLLVSFKLCRA